MQSSERKAAFNWLFEVVETYEMNVRTIFVSDRLMDRYLSCQELVVDGEGQSQLKLIAAVCLHVASKCEDVSCVHCLLGCMCWRALAGRIPHTTRSADTLAQTTSPATVGTASRSLNCSFWRRNF